MLPAPLSFCPLTFHPNSVQLLVDYSSEWSLFRSVRPGKIIPFQLSFLLVLPGDFGGTPTSSIQPWKFLVGNAWAIIKVTKTLPGLLWSSAHHCPPPGSFTVSEGLHWGRQAFGRDSGVMLNQWSSWPIVEFFHIIHGASLPVTRATAPGRRARPGRRHQPLPCSSAAHGVQHPRLRPLPAAWWPYSRPPWADRPTRLSWGHYLQFVCLQAC